MKENLNRHPCEHDKEYEESNFFHYFVSLDFIFSKDRFPNRKNRFITLNSTVHPQKESLANVGSSLNFQKCWPCSPFTRLNSKFPGMSEGLIFSYTSFPRYPYPDRYVLTRTNPSGSTIFSNLSGCFSID